MWHELTHFPGWRTNLISVYKLGDVGISSNLIGLLSMTNGHCPPPGRWIMKQWPAGVNSRFAEVTENDILWTQDITTANDTKKATNLGMKVFRDKQCFLKHTICSHVQCLLSCSPRFADASLLEQQLSFHSPISKPHPSQLHFHWAKRLHSRKFECHYSGTPPYGHPVNTVTLLLRPHFFGPAKRPYICL